MQLPIFQVLGRALWFELANLFTLFRLTWFPLALLIAAQIVVASFAVARAGDVAFASPEGILAFWGLMWTIGLLQMIAFAVVAVQVHRVILFNQRRPNEYFSYPFGGTELRYIVMGIISSIVVVVPFVVAMFAYFMMRMKVSAMMVFVALAPTNVKNSATDSLIFIVAIIVGLILSYWLMLRLSVWPPSVVANNRLWPGEAWRLTRGQAWAMLGLFILSGFVLIIAIIAIQTAFVVWFPASFASQVDAKAMLKDVVFNSVAPTDPNQILLEFISQFINTTFAVAIVSFAYKALRGLNMDQPIDAPNAGGSKDEDAGSSHSTPLHF